MASAIVIGATVDGLVAAHYLARAGHRVLVLDERSSASHGSTVGWVPAPIARDLALEQHGLRIERVGPWLAAPLEAGGHLELYQDIARSVESIRRVSNEDAQKWPSFCARMAAAARILESLYTAPPPDPLTDDRGELWQMAKWAFGTRRAGPQTVVDVLRFLPMPVADLLDDWFESAALKGALGAMAVMHQRQGPRASGSTFGLLHHHVGSPLGVFRPARSNIVQVLERRPGIEIRRNAQVAQIQVSGGRVVGVVLSGGEEISAALVVSSEHPRRALLDQLDTKWLDPALVRALRNVRARGVVARVTLVLDAAFDQPNLVIAPSLDYVQRAHDDGKYGRVAEQPWFVVSAHRVEPAYGERAAAATHRLEVHLQCAPYALRDDQGNDDRWDDSLREAIAGFVVQKLREQQPAITNSVRSISVEAPADLQAREGWYEGQAYDADLALDQALWMRPVPALARYRAPIEGLYLCGPAMHPGGGIAGAAGMNAAQEILRNR